MRHPIFRYLKYLFATSECLLLVFCTSCTGLFFQPSDAIYHQPQQFGLSYQELHIPVSAELTLHGWYLPATKPLASVLYFHGNTRNISAHIANVAWMPRRGLEVVMVDGHSEGTPEVQIIIADIHTVLAYWTDQRHPLPLMVLGQSLGGALALPLPL